MLFIVGCIIEVIFCTLSLFIATFYSQDWGYGNVFKESSVSLGNKDGWTLIDQYGAIYIFLIGLVIVAATIYLICFLTKHENIIPRFVIGIVFLIPIIFLIVAMNNALQAGQFVKMGFITIGAGTNSGLTNFGFLFLLASVTSFVLVCIGLKQRKEEQFNNSEKNVSEIKIKQVTQHEETTAEEWKL